MKGWSSSTSRWSEAKRYPIDKTPTKPILAAEPARRVPERPPGEAIGIAVDPEDHVWVASVYGRIQEFDTSGNLLGGVQAGQGAEPGKFFAPHGIVVSSRGDLFVLDPFHQRIRKFRAR